MPVLWAASLRHLLRHPAQLLLALIGLSVGVGTIIAVDIATASSGRAFQLSMQAVNGAATHAIVGGPQGVDERVYVELRTGVGGGLVRPALAPVVEGYITVGERDLQLVGVDPLAAGEVGGAEPASREGPTGGGPAREPMARGGDAAGAVGAGEAGTGAEGSGAVGASAGGPGARRGGARGGGPTDGDGGPAVGGGGLSGGGAGSSSGGGLSGGGAGSSSGGGGPAGGGGDLTSWFTRPGAVVMAAGTARELGLTVNQSFEVQVGGRAQRAVLIGTVAGDRPGYDSLVLTDIAQAQDWLGAVGRLARIDVRVAEGERGKAALEWLRGRLPADVRLEEAGGRAQQSVDMTAAFTTNLQAMSMLALLVSTLLIYGAISFAVVQRRRIIGILRALGATRGNVFTIVLTEAAVLGVVGASLGLLLGLLIGRGLVHLVSQTINDLYFVVAVNETVLPGISIAKALLAGIGTSLLGAWLPALEVAGSSPQLALRRSSLEGRAVTLARKLLIASAALAVGSAVVAVSSSRSLLAGFIALFLLLLSAATLTPAVLRALARAAAAVAGRFSPVARLVFGDVAASLSRTGVAVAALGMALAAMIGVSIMVESFRESLREWLASTMRADIYMTAPGPGAGRPERKIDPDLLQALLSTPGVIDYGMSRRVTLNLPQGPVSLDAAQFAHSGYANMTITVGDPSATWSAFEKGDVVISEPLAYRMRLGVGDSLTLPTDAGSRAFRIAGIYREYGNDRGTVLMSMKVYRSHWRDDGVTGVGVYVAPGQSLQKMMAAFRSEARGRQSLFIRSNAELRALSMNIFERTFVITRVLYWLAAGVAAVGLVSALLAWELERAHELAILRSLGLTPAGAGLLIEGQTGFMGAVALLAAIPSGLLTALLLIDVINRRAFGWRIDVHLSWPQFVNALLLAVVAAAVAGLYPARRVARAAIAGDIREE